jgi:hypothetical protein
MKKKIKLLSCFLLIASIVFIAASSSLHAQVVGTSNPDFKKAGGSGSLFLKIGVGARAMGMGGAFSGVADDITALYWNPAGIAALKGVNIGFEYNSWFADMKHSFAGISFPVSEEYKIGLSVVIFDAGSIDITTLTSPEGTGSSYSVSDIAIGGTIAGKLTEQFSFGITLKYIQNTIFDLTANTLAVDAGTLYDLGLDGLRLGLGVTNLGGEASFEGQSLSVGVNREADQQANITSRPLDAQLTNTPYSLPLSFRAGLSYDFLKGTENQNLIVAGDFIHLSDNPEKFHLGAEYVWNNLLSIRGGYQARYDELGFTLGGGVKFNTESFSGSFDYVYADLGRLGAANRIGVRLTF